MEPGLIRDTLWSLFKKYVTNIEFSEKRDENKQLDIMTSIEYLMNAEEIKKKIKLIWGLNDDLLAGVFVYLDATDEYFNPRFNNKDLFFDKIYIFNKNKLEKIGKKIIKPIFPFVSLENYDKKIVLLR